MKELKPTIFVSSTITDLPSEREAARRGVENIPAIPRMSEFTIEAHDQSSVDVCLNEVKKADFYVLILGGRYGYILDDGVSITEREYETAVAAKKPIFVFNASYFPKEDKQAEFARKAGSQRFWKDVKNAFELGEEITKALRAHIERVSYEKKQDTEPLFTNLLELNFPTKLYLAKTNFRRADVIEDSNGRLRKGCKSKVGHTRGASTI